MKEKKVKEEKVLSIKEKVDYAVFKNAHINRDQIKDWLKRDIQGVYVLLAEMLRSEDAIDALADVYFERYKKFHAEKARQPELELNGKPSRGKDEENE